MRWLERVFGKKETLVKPEEPVKKIFTVNDLKEFLSACYRREMDPFFEAIKSKYGEIQDAVSDFQKGLENLAAARYAGPVDEHLLSVVVGRRGNFIQKMKEVAKHLRAPVRYDFDSILNYSNSSAFSVNHANASTVEDYAVVVELFRKEASQVASNFKRVESLLTELGGMIKEKSSFASSAASLNGMLAAITAGISSVSEKKNLINELHAGIAGLHSNQSEISGKIANLEKSDEWKAGIEMMRQRSSLQARKSELSSEMTQAISPLLRPIKKFKNLVDNGKESFDDKKFIELVLDNYIDAVASGSPAVFNSLLEKLEKNILDNKISLEKKAGKILQAIADLRENARLAVMKSSYEALSKEIAGLDAAIANSQTDSIKIKLEADLESVKQRINEQSVRLLDEESGLKLILDGIDKAKSELELQAGNLIGDRVSLDLKLPPS